MSARQTARSHGLIACETCGQLSQPPAEHRGKMACPTCGGKIESRKDRMISRTWALVIAGFVLYIPANLYPVMTFNMVGNAESDTIMSGVVELFQSGMWAIGLLVLCASITVPLAKLIGLAYLLFTVQRGHHTRTKDRTRLYRIIELIGRWSMLDVFLVSILIAVVNLGQVATISPDIGAVFFASVVIVTMFAAQTFDPRLIWDRAER
ncbi:paraquat-inducible protein A [Cerasicoccus fimbriatus]|uniref:paraquat-inducible protein A n=1 Tax=Cerasicoccus fimbriatus TaxID=3014554 RepID=UPI0022B4E3A2|nr:paraquat-inducible protein A [Cerasicoccus sp. TK19100]